jgi:nitrogen fixation protein NifU and related proteins
MMDDDTHALLLSLYLHPTRKGFPTHPQRVAGRKSTMCRDYLEMGIWLSGDVVTDARFQGKGCVICEVAASLTTDMLVGQNIAALCDIEPGDILALLEMPLAPAKQECALLSWRIVRLLVAGELLQRL